MDVLRMIQRCFKDILRQLHGFFKSASKGVENEVSKNNYASFNVVSGKFQWGFKSGSKVLPGSFEGGSRKF